MGRLSPAARRAVARKRQERVLAAKISPLLWDNWSKEKNPTMAKSLNKVTLIGNVGADPEISTTHGGTHVAKVSLATNRSFENRSGKQEERTEWHRITFFDKLADVVGDYVQKGDRIYIEGRIEYSTSEGDDGETRYWTDIVARELIMLGGKKADSTRDDDQDDAEDEAPKRRPSKKARR